MCVQEKVSPAVHTAGSGWDRGRCGSLCTTEYAYRILQRGEKNDIGNRNEFHFRPLGSQLGENRFKALKRLGNMLIDCILGLDVTYGVCQVDRRGRIYALPVWVSRHRPSIRPPVFRDEDTT